MTTTVKIEAHCDDETIVIVDIANKDGIEETVFLQDGESLEKYVYDDRKIVVMEIKK